MNLCRLFVCSRCGDVVEGGFTDRPPVTTLCEPCLARLARSSEEDVWAAWVDLGGEG